MPVYGSFSDARDAVEHGAARAYSEGCFISQQNGTFLFDRSGVKSPHSSDKDSVSLPLDCELLIYALGSSSA